MLLDRLCERYGVATYYTDIWGQQRQVEARTKRAVLSALGVVVADDAAILQSLQQFDASTWQERLPPVHVVRVGQDIEVTLTLPRKVYETSLGWSLTEESGQRHTRSIGADDWIEIECRAWNGEDYRRAALRIEHGPPVGYHRLEIYGQGTNKPLAACALIVAPPQCYVPPALEGNRRVWGFAVQLYSVRSQRNAGVGDMTDLRRLVEIAGAKGAAYVGVSPLHALMQGESPRISPYSPSSRAFVNPIYIDVEETALAIDSPQLRERLADAAIQAQLRALRSEPLVDYATIAELKTELLKLAYSDFVQSHIQNNSASAQSFAAFKRGRGEALYGFALFEALHEHFQQQLERPIGWHNWPLEYQSFSDPAVSAFAQAHAEQVDFHCFLQWQVDSQLRGVGRRSLELGLGVGLYADLAIGVASDGADAWMGGASYVADVTIGAPPDEFNPHGQNWGLVPLSPQRLRAAAYAPFIAILRANMRHAGALRIDHVMGLMRLFCVPSGADATAGTYLSYAFDEMLGVLALESQRNRCLVVGEDLGTVPEEVRSALGPAGVYSTRLLYFERQASGNFKPPAEYEKQALAAVGTHDLPTLSGFWRGVDLDRRRELNLFANEDARTHMVLERAQDHARLLIALEREQLLPEGMSVHTTATPEMTLQLACAIYAYLARTSSQLVSVAPEDVFGQMEQMNLPGTTQEHPNWRRRLTVPLEDWISDPRLDAVMQVLFAQRGLPRSSHGVTPDSAREPAVATIPRATYRLQLSREFTFAQATQIIPYLSALGISHCYTSPYLKARPGSLHGYDIVDHNAFNPEIGSEDDFARFVAALRQHEMGHVLDMVPNHMGVMASDNAWWLDVLENGPAAKHAEFFDIDWDPILDAARGKVLLPVLGDQYGAVLEKGELQLFFDAATGEFSVNYYEHRFPVSPREYPRVLSHRIERLVERVGSDHPALIELQSLITAFSHLPGHRQTAPEKVAVRAREKELYKRRLAGLVGESADVARFVNENVQTYNARTEPTPALLHELLEAQAYRLSYWRVAADDINYRRFFDINDLAALRMENPDVFAATHRLVFKLLAEGSLDGLRIDHPDGLYSPKAYFDALQSAFTPVVAENDARGKPIYLLVEKILAGYERVPQDWPVHGTTGYEFCNLVNGVFIDNMAENELDDAYHDFIGEELHFDELLYRNKRLIMRVSLASELNVLAVQLQRIALADTHTRDFTLNSLRDALVQIVACFPVYRTYVTREGVSAEDRRYVDWAVAVAKRRGRAADVSVLDFVRDVLLAVDSPSRSPEQCVAVSSFAMKFQQYTGPVMAKALEDTSFYTYNRLIALNEVGGDPRRFGTSVAAFHRANQERLAQWPHAMLTTSTHDSKRSEDVRTRIDVISELAPEWNAAVQRWKRINRGRRREVEGRELAPSRNDEYLLYQALLGVWPVMSVDDERYVALCDRIDAFMTKAVREAKVHSSWINPDADYEKALSNFVRGILLPREGNRFVSDFASFAARVATAGVLNSLSQVVLKIVSPGVPDIYQGNELLEFNLVDPDNRRPVDYQLRGTRLDTLRAAAEQHDREAFLGGLINSPSDGGAKLYVTWRALSLRSRYPTLFQNGRYIPLNVEGVRSERLVACARIDDQVAAIAVVPRLVARMIDEQRPWPSAQAWGDTTLQVPAELAGDYVDVFTGEHWQLAASEQGSVTVGALLDRFPVALLVRDAPPRH